MKDYLRLFMTYCRTHEIEYNIDAHGYLRQVYMCKYLGAVHEDQREYIPHGVDLKFGNKPAYNWIKRAYRAYLDQNTGAYI